MADTGKGCKVWHATLGTDIDTAADIRQLFAVDQRESSHLCVRATRATLVLGSLLLL